MRRTIVVLILAIVVTSLVSRASWPAEIAVRISNITDRSFTILWKTKTPQAGWIEYGQTKELGSVAYDVRGKDTKDVLHYVTLKDLKASTPYYYRVMPSKTTTSPEIQTTGPEIGLPGFRTVYGQIVKSDGTTPVANAVALAEILDANGAEDSGHSTLVSGVSDASGYWNMELGCARVPDLTSYFRFSEEGDKMALAVESSAQGRSQLSLKLSDCAEMVTVTLKGRQK
ncbi:fibronectin type III domain-containing protein [Candidatus Poribacteria bacterium]|nr:fibronectin type III domain-containing protein [Candidatus Poribacteria bacterium]